MGERTQTQRVLRDLKRKRKTGVIATDYPSGFPIRSRIPELRAFYKIESRKDHLTGTNLVRYFYIRRLTKDEREWKAIESELASKVIS